MKKQVSNNTEIQTISISTVVGVVNVAITPSSVMTAGAKVGASVGFTDGD